MNTAEDIHKIALSKLAGEILKSLPDEDLRAIVAEGLSTKITDYTRDWKVQQAVEAATKEKVTEILKTPEYQAKLAERARNSIDELLPLMERAIAETFLYTFGASRDSYKDSVFAEHFEKVLDKRYGKIKTK